MAVHTLQHLLALGCQLLQLHHLLLLPLQGLIVLVARTLQLPFTILPAAVDAEAVLLGAPGVRLLQGEPCLQVLVLHLQLGQDCGEAGLHDGRQGLQPDGLVRGLFKCWLDGEARSVISSCHQSNAVSLSHCQMQA